MMKQVLFCILVYSFVSVLAAPERPSENSPKSTDKKNIKTNEELSREMSELRRRIDELEDKVEKDAETRGLIIKGYFDINISNYQKKPNVFEIGNFEIQMEHNYPQNIQVAAALVFDKKGARLGVGFIDYHLFGSSISPRGRLFQEKGAHIQVGKFDVPFGNDWQFFSPVDRISVTAPLTTERIMDGGYNDVGARFLLNMVWFNTSLHILRGIEEGYSYGGNSMGGRIGFTPINDPYTLSKKGAPLELGVSYLYDVDKEGRQAEKMWSVDFETKSKYLFLKSEYTFREKIIGIRDKGYHITGGIDINAFPLILFTRYDDVVHERYKLTIESGEISRVSSGFRYSMHDIAFIKCEFSHYLKRKGTEKDDEYFTRNLFYLQLMIRF